MMIKPSKEFLQEALTNNTFDVDSTDKAIRMTVDHSFSYLYRLQRNMASYEELFYTTRNTVENPDYGDLFLDKRERPCVNFPTELILPQQREKFRNSKYYKESIPYNDLAKDHTLFARLPVLLVDDHLVRNFELELFDDFFTAHLPFDRYFIYDKIFNNNEWNYVYKEHNFSLQVINNAFYQDVVTNTGMMKQNSYSGSDFDRLLASYLKALGLALTPEDKGTYFASVFLNDELLGSQLQDVTFDRSGDVVIHFDKETEELLKNNNGNITIRFIFYRYLYSYESYHDDGEVVNKLVRTRTRNEKITSELFLIAKENDVLYQLPIPTENLLVFKSSNYNLQNIQNRSHFPNKNVEINYPNIYHIDNDIEEGDRFRIFYFYIPPYDLSYEYMYWFYYNYLKYKWSKYALEESINRIYFGDMDFSGDPAFEEMNQLTAAVQARSMYNAGKISENDIDTCYDYILNNSTITSTTEFVKFNALKALDGDVDNPIPTKIEQFAAIFEFVIQHEITPYFYDEMDFLRKYSEKISPLEYKVSKLKSFIKDDYNALHNYVSCQNKIGIKYEFSANEINLQERYKTTYEDGTPLPEPMYLFPVTKPDPDVQLSARIFIDGLICPTFVYKRYEFSDYIYIPNEYIKEDSYFEIEVFPALTEHHVMEFSYDNISSIVEFHGGENIAPTLSDIFFYFGEDSTKERLPLEDFRLELISTEYNYYTENPPKEIPIFFRGKDSIKMKGNYYDIDGRCYTFEGIRIEDQDISSSELSTKIANGELIQDSGYETKQELNIVRDTEVVTYDKVALGESIIVPNNKNVIYSCVSKIKVTPLKTSYYGKKITISIAKRPSFEGSKLQTLTFPSYILPIENSQNVEEYTRAFKNGRLLSKNRYDYTDIDGFLAIQVLEKMKKGETMAFDISPYRNRLVYYTRRIESDCIDLRGYINKPFDNRFYEVYINGRRLNRTNIYPFSPWEIKLGGLHSTYNLEIYEKDRDWEYYGADFDDYFTLSDFIRKAFMEKDIADRLIHDVTGDVPPNDDTEEPMPWGRDVDLISVYFEMFYYMKLIPMGYVDGERNDFDTEEIAKKYPIIDQLYHIKNDLGEDVLFLDPNNYYKGTPDAEGNETWNAYLLGNADLSALEEP